MVGLFPTELGRRFAPGVTKLHREFRAAVGPGEIDNMFPRRFLRRVPQPRAAERDTRVGRCAGHFDINQARAAHGPGAIMHQMPIAGHAVGGEILSHWRNHDAVGYGQLTQAQRREHRCGTFGGNVDPGLNGIISVEIVLDRGQECGVAQFEIVPGDRFRARHDHHRELLRRHIPGTCDMFEPGERHAGIVLSDLDRGGAAVAVGVERRRHVALMLDQRIGQRDRALHRQLGPRSDREMGSRHGIAKEHDPAVRPAAAADPREIAPQRAVDEQRMAFEILREDHLKRSRRLILVHRVKTVSGPAFGRRFDHPGRVVAVILIAVGDDDAVGRLAEEIGEVAQRAGRAHPGEFVAGGADNRLERGGTGIADATVGAVRRDDHVGRGEALLDCRRVDRHAIVAFDPDRVGARLEDLEQLQPRATRESVAAATDVVAFVPDADVVPIGEGVSDHRVGFGISAEEFAECLVRKDNAEAERVIGLVLLEQLNLPIGPRFFDENAEIEAPRSAADDGDPQAVFL